MTDPTIFPRTIAGAELASSPEPTTGFATDRVGPYKLVRTLGEGGMGEVWLAEQTEPVRRQVALKLIKPGMDSSQVIARFEAERQALALMDHPNIARVLDAGTTAWGRPFFVMELVQGVPITEFCDASRLTTRERIELFLPVCQAVQHAHQKGVIHRDLKPSNVLVAQYDGKPVPKVIDFGIAKALAQDGQRGTMLTQIGTVLGTPEYMAPEQAENGGLDVDTRADVYSLGVMLYELLTGQTPFGRERFRTLALPDILKMIQHEEPETPSRMLTTKADVLGAAALSRRTEPRHLKQLLKGELDWIAMKALDKERDRRYETANGLALDLRRFLDDEPVLARPASAGYRLLKFARKYKAGVGVAAMLLLALIAGVVGTSYGLFRASRERDVAIAAQTQTREALDALTEDVVEKLLAKQPVLGPAEKQFLQKIVGFYEGFAAQVADQASSRELTARGNFKVGLLRQKLGETAAAEASFRKAAASYAELAAQEPTVALYRRKHADCRSNIAILLSMTNRGPAAEVELRQSLAEFEALVAEQPSVEDRRKLADVRLNLGVYLAVGGKKDEADAHYRQAIAGYAAVLADEPTPETWLKLADARSNLGIVLHGLARRSDAEAEYRQSIELLDRLVVEQPALSEPRRSLSSVQNNLATLLTELDREGDAEIAYRRAIELLEKLVAEQPGVPEYRQRLTAGCNNLGVLLRGLGKQADAEPVYRRGIEVLERLVVEQPNQPGLRRQLAGLTVNYGAVLMDLKKPAEAALARVVELYEQLASEQPTVREHRQKLAHALSALATQATNAQRYAEAEKRLVRSLELRERLFEEQPTAATAKRDLFVAYRDRAANLDWLKRFDEALPHWERAIAMAEPGQLPSVRVGRGYNRVSAGLTAVGLAEIDDVTADSGTTGLTLYNSGCAYAIAVGQQSDDAGRTACVEKAIALLVRARDAGYFRVKPRIAAMMADPDMALLLPRAEFKEFVTGLE